MEILGWVLLMLSVTLGLNHLRHIFKLKTDPYYRFQINQAAKIRDFEKSTLKPGFMPPKFGKS